MRVAYRETMLGDAEDCVGTGRAEEDRMVGNNRRFAKIAVRIEPLIEEEEEEEEEEKELGVEVVMRNEIDLSAVSMSSNAKAPENTNTNSNADDDGNTPAESGGGGSGVGLRQAQCDSIRDAINTVLSSGPIAGYPITGVRISLDPKGCEFDEDSTPAACFTCAVRATKRAFKNGPVSLLEPQMNLIVSSPSAYVGTVVADLSSASRSGLIVDVGANVDAEDYGRKDSLVAATQIKADVPLRGMVGYSTDLRSLTSGEASFSMTFDRYAPIVQAKVVKAIQEEALELEPKILR